MEAKIAIGDPEPDEEVTTSNVVNTFLRKRAASNVEPNTSQKHVVEGQVSSRGQVRKSQVKMNLSVNAHPSPIVHVGQ